jgi:uncharacterized protein (TIGR02145 family)
MNVRISYLPTLFLIHTIIALSMTNALAEEAVTDADGNAYATVKIGDQVWTVENLRTTKFNDTTPIPLITVPSQWAACDDEKKPACCWYGNDTVNRKTYGALYNWYAVNTGRLAPKGWHVSTDDEWVRLEEYLSDSGYNLDETKEERKIAKSMAAKTSWAWGSRNDFRVIGNDLAKNNRSGFSALPGGFRLTSGNFRNIGTTGRWWTATEYDTTRAWRFNLRYDADNLNREYYYKGCGYSVRLVKDRE